MHVAGFATENAPRNAQPRTHGPTDPLSEFILVRICHNKKDFFVFSFPFFMCINEFTLFCATYPYFEFWIWETRTSVTLCPLQSTMFIISIKLLLINALYLKSYCNNVNILIYTNPHSIWHKWMNFIQYVIIYPFISCFKLIDDICWEFYCTVELV
jgi:hypothetical protein